MPKIEKGYWILLDIFRNERNFIDGKDSETWLLNNFSIGVIDIDTNMFYYIKDDV